VLVFHSPSVLLPVSFLTLWFAGWLGASRFKGLKAQVAELGVEFGVIRGATLTLLGLLIAFTLSLALSRFEQRRMYEVQEANAIHTEYLRADLLPQEDAAKIRVLLRSYLEQRLLFYTAGNEGRLEQINAETARLQANLWTLVQAPASARPGPTVALAVAGMNDVLNSEAYATSGWSYHIPTSDWVLMTAIAICASVLVGVDAKDPKSGSRLLVILPIVVSIALFLIADIDSPREGLIRSRPISLLHLSNLLNAP